MRPCGAGDASLVTVLATLALVAACDDASSPPVCDAEILTSSVAANADNVLSAIVVVRARSMDSVRVRFGSSPASLDSLSAAVIAGGDSTVIPVLGLLPQTTYALQPIGFAACGSVTTQPLSFTSGALPIDLPTYTTSGNDPTPGFVAFAAGLYGVVIDNTGRVVWYHRFPASPGLNFQPQPGRGRYFARPSNAPTEQGQWVEIDPLGNVTRNMTCARGLQPRMHDLIAVSDGSFWLMCDETRTMDLSALGGAARAQVTGTAVQHLSAVGAVLFEWSPFDHLSITDLDSADRVGPNVNWTHGNALDLDRDGNLIVSFRSLSEITKIDTRTGAVLWRMGGRAGQFSPVGASTTFARQHGVRVASSGELLLLDNLSDARESRAKRLSYVASASPSVQLMRSYGSQPPVVALLGGSTQELPNGRVLVAFGNGGRVEEYDAAGNVVWRINGNAGYVFRASRFPSLYNPGGYGR